MYIHTYDRYNRFKFAEIKEINDLLYSTLLIFTLTFIYSS